MSKNIHQPIDKLHKIAAIYFMEHLLSYIGDERKVKGVYKNELVTQNYRTQLLDCVIELDDGSLIDLEFHNDVLKIKDMSRYAEYTFNLNAESGKNVYPHIICHGEREKSVLVQKVNEDIQYKPKIIFFKDYSAEEKLKNIKDKIESNSELTDKEKLDLIFLVFMKSDRSIAELVEEVCLLVNEISGLTNHELEGIKACHYILIHKFVAKERRKRLIQGEIMNNVCISEYGNYLQNKGMRKGIKEGKLETAKNLLNSGFSMKVAMNMTKLDKKTIKEYMKTQN